jgi:lipopolysaccharide/colanic/teichoic acid biosynthesis glycosyltransferase
MATQSQARPVLLSVRIASQIAAAGDRSPACSRVGVGRRTFDAFCSLGGISLLIPVGLLIALAIKLDDGGAIFYSQARVGKGLQRFSLLKFRTMRASIENESLLTQPGDSRVTRVGRILRKYKLDELPQLVNVLRGEMQLVGIRPQVEKYVDCYREEYKELLREPPGVTGLASLCFRNEEQMYVPGVPLEEQYVQAILPAKLRIALAYLQTRTFWSDLDIICRTVLGLQAPARSQKKFRIDSDPPFLSKIVSRNPS